MFSMKLPRKYIKQTNVLFYATIVLFFPILITSRQKTLFDLFFDVHQGFVDRRLCPHFVKKGPEKRVEITFNRTTGSLVGNVFLGNLTFNKPTLQWNVTDSTLYTMTMTYVEEMLRNWTFHEYTHWLVTNIPGNDIEKGDTVFEFTKPTLINAENYYMHVVLIFKQKDRINVEIAPELRADDAAARKSIRMMDFVEKYDLGDPEYGCWFYTYQPNDYDEWLMFAHPDILSYFQTMPSFTPLENETSTTTIDP